MLRHGPGPKPYGKIKSIPSIHEALRKVFEIFLKLTTSPFRAINIIIFNKKSCH